MLKTQIFLIKENLPIFLSTDFKIRGPRGYPPSSGIPQCRRRGFLWVRDSEDPDLEKRVEKKQKKQKRFHCPCKWKTKVIQGFSLSLTLNRHLKPTFSSNLFSCKPHERVKTLPFRKPIKTHFTLSNLLFNGCHLQLYLLFQIPRNAPPSTNPTSLFDQRSFQARWVLQNQ